MAPIGRSEMQSRRRFSSRVWLWLLLPVALALRLYQLGVASLWYDETVSLYLARLDLLALTRHTAGDIHPPLYYYLLHYWGRLAGWTEFSAAFLSLFFGVLLIALVYRVAREWFGRGVGLAAAFLVAISPYNLWYSQEVRMYTLGAVLGLASVYFLVRLLTTFATRAQSVPFRVSLDFAAYVIVSALGLYTLYYFAFLLVFENLFAVLWIARLARFPGRPFSAVFSDTASILRDWLLSQLAIAVLYLPWLPTAVHQAVDPPVPPWRSFTLFSAMLVESFSALALGQSVDPAAVWPVLAGVAAVLVFAMCSSRGITRRHPVVGELFLLGYTLVPLLVIYGMSLFKPLYHVRYMFVYSPGFYMLFALGLERLWARPWRIPGCWLAGGLVALLTAASVYSAYNFWYDPRYADDDLRGAVTRLADQWRPGDAILLDAGYTYTAFVYYYDQPVAWRGRLIDYVAERADARGGAVVLQAGSIGGGPSLGWNSRASDFYATTAAETRAALDRVFAAHPRVWLLRLYDTVVDPDGVIRAYLADRGRLVDELGVAGQSYARVEGYLTTRAAPAELPAQATPRGVLLGNRIVLVGFEPSAATVRAGMPLDVTVYWQAREPTNVDQHLFVGLYAQDGQLVASRDEMPLGNACGTSRWSRDELLTHPVRLAVPPNLPGGAYRLRVALYNPLTEEPLVAESSAWTMENGQVELAAVEVEP